MATVGNASTLIITSSVELGHTPLLTVHKNWADVGIDNPVTPEIGTVGLVTVAVLLKTVHTPLPAVGTLAESAAVVVLQSVWSSPELAVVGASIVIITSSVVLPQEPFVILHRNVVLDGTAKPVIVVFGLVLSEILAVPLTTVHKPLPTVAVFPDNKAVAELQSVWSDPAMAVVGKVSTTITIPSLLKHTP